MAGTFLKWLVACVITVGGGTALAISQTGAATTADLGARATASLGGEFSWANVRIDGRDVVLGGTATDQQMIDGATSRLSAIHGVRAVVSDVVLAEFVSPFPFAASVKDGNLSLSGGYPSEDIHRSLVAELPTVADSTRLLSGAPESSKFLAAAEFGLGAVQQFDQGEMSLADLTLTISGRAKSPEAFDALQTMRTSVPPGVQLAALTVTPPIATPYVWTAKYDGLTVSVSGDAPDDTLADQLRAAAPAGISVSTTLSLASGEPSGFDANALSLLQSLLLLESGEARISNETITLSGAPATSAIADQVTAAVAAIGGVATLEPPRVADYALTMTKQANALAFSGFVPDAATREKLAALAGADVSSVSLARGAPERFASAVEFGLSALSHLAEGQFAIKANRLSLTGRTGSVAEFKVVADMIGEGAPQGLTLAASDIRPPIANPFKFAAVRSEDGKTTLSGFVPDENVRAALHGKIAALASDSADPADGAPEAFSASAQKGLDVLGLLDSGSLIFDGSNWSIDGIVSDTKKGFAADAAYSIAGLRTAGWTYNVHLPKPKAQQALPIIAPYVWRVQKTTEGAIAFSGFVPAEAFQRVAKSRASGAVDSTVLGAGAPPDFGTSALAGLDALLALDEGSLSLSGTRWALTGVASNSTVRETVQNHLTAQINPGNWQVAIQAKDGAPIVTPYLWSAKKAVDGGIELTGYVPSDTLRAEALASAGLVARDTTTIAAGEPAGFATDLAAGLAALGHLTQGEAAFDGSKWVLSGEIAATTDGDAAVAALSKGSKAGAVWTVSIADYPPPPPEPSSSQAPTSSEEPASSSLVAEDIVSLAPPAASSEIPTSSEESSSTEAIPAVSEGASVEPVSSSELASSSVSASSPDVSSSSVPTEIASSSASSEEPVDVTREAPTAIDAVPPLPQSFAFEATRTHGAAIALKGAVPAAAAAKYFGTVAGGADVSALVVTPGLPADFITNALTGIDALGKLSEARLGFDGTRWWLRGKAEQQPANDAVLAAIAALPKGADWSVSLDLLAPIDVCKDKVATVAGRNAIVFKSGGAVLLPESLPVLDDLATDLALCPKSYVHVQGHTDGDGAEDVNLALSVARAEAVVTELIKRGVGEERLYAEGYGESEPVAPNDTKDGKRKNRRIAFEITAE